MENIFHKIFGSGKDSYPLKPQQNIIGTETMLNEIGIFDSKRKRKEKLYGKKPAYWENFNSSQASCVPMKIGKEKRFNKKKFLHEFGPNWEEQSEYFEMEV